MRSCCAFSAPVASAEIAACSGLIIFSTGCLKSGIRLLLGATGGRRCRVGVYRDVRWLGL